ncbi:hypothetical protein BHM03_00056743 [Ensete ventricosum]|nr:hypothetical protein BHM03_00056743 [Ensete ventricosum]
MAEATTEVYRHGRDAGAEVWEPVRECRYLVFKLATDSVPKMTFCIPNAPLLYGIGQGCERASRHRYKGLPETFGTSNTVLKFIRHLTLVISYYFNLPRVEFSHVWKAIDKIKTNWDSWRISLHFVLDSAIGDLFTYNFTCSGSRMISSSRGALLQLDCHLLINDGLTRARESLQNPQDLGEAAASLRGSTYVVAFYYVSPWSPLSLVAFGGVCLDLIGKRWADTSGLGGDTACILRPWKPLDLSSKLSHTEMEESPMPVPPSPPHESNPTSASSPLPLCQQHAAAQAKSWNSPMKLYY